MDTSILVLYFIGLAIILLSLAYYFRPKLLTEKELKEAEEKQRIEKNKKVIIIRHEFSVRSGFKFGFGLVLGIIVAIILVIILVKIVELALVTIFGLVLLEKLGLLKI